MSVSDLQAQLLRPLGSVKAEAAFHFISRGKIERQLQVAQFKGQERVSTPHEFDIEVIAPQDIDPLTTLEEGVLGHPGTLVMGMENGETRAVHGLVTAYEVLRAFDGHTVRVRLRLSARISALKLRHTSRIFQELTIPEIVSQVLKEWRVPFSLQLVGKYEKRSYVTQYQETDFDFVSRLLAREGIFYTFEQPSSGEKETLILSDSAMYRPIAGRDSSLTVRTGRFEIGEGEITELGVRRGIRPTSARLGDFDFRHPNLPLRSLELQKDPKGYFGDLGTDRLGTYLFGHEGETELAASAEKRNENANRLLESLRADGMIIVGTSRTRALMPGASFNLEGHLIAALNQGWVVVSVSHEGHTPELSPQGTEHVYLNELEAAPVGTALRPAFQTRARLIQGTQTATVVGGPDGEVFTDSFGRVKVQFHWDLDGHKDDKSSTWIRVAQPWAGAGFGAQFLPRVGTEVVVTFLDGDPDRPMIIGTVFNGTNPHPFGLPQARHKSGFRSISIPGSRTANEFSFDDERGQEAVILKAQRNFDLAVEKDQSSTIGGNAMLRVEGQLTETVTGTHTTTVLGGQTTLVTLHATTQVLGDMIDAVRGNTDRRVSGDETVRIEGTKRDDLAMVDSTIRKDSVMKVRGHSTTVVGESGAPTSATLHVEGTLSTYSSKMTELVSEKGFSIRCGESLIKIGPKGIEVSSPNITLSGDTIQSGAGDKFVVASPAVVLKGDDVQAIGKSASLHLHSDADVGGNKVKIKSKMDEASVSLKSKPLTTISLSDEDGTPARRRRFVVVTAAGERGGVLNDKGEATLELDADAKIYFPDVDKPREA